MNRNKGAKSLLDSGFKFGSIYYFNEHLFGFSLVLSSDKQKSDHLIIPHLSSSTKVEYFEFYPMCLIVDSGFIL